jgi:hypothetical protein
MKTKEEKELINKIINSNKIKWNNYSSYSYRGVIKENDETVFEINLETDNELLILEIQDGESDVSTKIMNQIELQKLLKKVKLNCLSEEQESINKLITLL